MLEHNPSADVTVVIPVRNGASFIEHAVRSVINQNISTLRLVVSDNGSTDETLNILRKFENNRCVRVVRQTESLSMLGHFNKCLDMIQTEFYMLLCHDDFLRNDDAIGRALFVMKSLPAVSAVYCDMDYVDRSGRYIARRQFYRSGIFDAQAFATRRSIISMRNQFGIPLLIRTKSVKSHRYVEQFPYIADVEMSIFLSSKGATYHLQDSLIANRYHASNGTRTLHGSAMIQMRKMAENYSIPLGRKDLLMMFVNAVLMRVSKFMFFQYLAVRERFVRG